MEAGIKQERLDTLIETEQVHVPTLLFHAGSIGLWTVEHLASVFTDAVKFR